MGGEIWIWYFLIRNLLNDSYLLGNLCEWCVFSFLLLTLFFWAGCVFSFTTFFLAFHYFKFQFVTATVLDPRFSISIRVFRPN